MRVADKMAYDQVNRAISKNRSEMADLQNQAATQKRVTKPSDDPVSASRVLGSRIELRGSEQYIKNLNYAKGFLDFTEQSLNELTEVFVRAKELVLSQASDASSSPQTRRVVAEELKQLLNQAVQISNRKHGERFIFGGFKTTESPFDERGNYQGDMGEMRIHIDKDSFLPMNIPGAVVFQGKGLSRDGFSNKNIEQAKSVEKLNQQRAESPEVFRGVDAGNNVEAENPVDAENPMRGPASLRTTENVISTTSDGGQDGVNLFQTLKKIQIALMTDDKEGIQESVDRIDDALQQVIVARTALGSRVMSIENTLSSLHTNVVDTKTGISNLEDADAFAVISDINKTESALQATLQTSGKLMQKSLMDFIS